MRLVVENRKHGRMEKIYLDKTNDDFSSLLYEDGIDNFLLKLQIEYDVIISYFEDITNQIIGCSIVGDTITHDSFSEIFVKYSEFIEKIMFDNFYEI